MKHIKKIVLLLVCLSLAASLFGCSGILTKEERAESREAAAESEFRAQLLDKTPVLSGATFKTYDTLAESLTHCLAAIRCTVVSHTDDVNYKKSYLGYQNDGGHNMTKYSALVDDVLYGDAALAGTEVSLLMPYGVYEGNAMRLHEDYPVLELGRQYILLLGLDSDDTSAYSLVSPSATWVLVGEDGGIEAPAELAEPLLSAGTTADEICAAIKAAAAELE